MGGWTTRSVPPHGKPTTCTARWWSPPCVPATMPSRGGSSTAFGSSDLNDVVDPGIDRYTNTGRAGIAARRREPWHPRRRPVIALGTCSRIKPESAWWVSHGRHGALHPSAGRDRLLSGNRAEERRIGLFGQLINRSAYRQDAAGDRRTARVDKPAPCATTRQKAWGWLRPSTPATLRPYGPAPCGGAGFRRRPWR